MHAFIFCVNVILNLFLQEKVGPFNAFKQLVVCNYAKNGNTLSKAMYLQGEACSQCSEGYSCEGGLCAKN